MKLTSLFLISFALTTTAMASDTLKSFTCANANGSVIATEKKLTVVRETSLKHFDTVVKENVDASVMPDKNVYLVYAKADHSVSSMDVLVVKDLTDRKTLTYEHDKGGMDSMYMVESYKIKVDLSLQGRASQVIDMDCTEETQVID